MSDFIFHNFFVSLGVIFLVFGVLFAVLTSETLNGYDTGDEFEVGASFIFVIVGVVLLIFGGDIQEEMSSNPSPPPTAEAPLTPTD